MKRSKKKIEGKASADTDGNKTVKIKGGVEIEGKKGKASGGISGGISKSKGGKVVGTVEAEAEFESLRVIFPAACCERSAERVVP